MFRRAARCHLPSSVWKRSIGVRKGRRISVSNTSSEITGQSMPSSPRIARLMRSVPSRHGVIGWSNQKISGRFASSSGEKSGQSAAVKRLISG